MDHPQSCWVWNTLSPAGYGTPHGHAGYGTPHGHAGYATRVVHAGYATRVVHAGYVPPVYMHLPTPLGICTSLHPWVYPVSPLVYGVPRAASGLSGVHGEEALGSRREIYLVWASLSA